ncbi:hypothetical protein M0802_004813 [Mischocyttarus mexicanus]|nr:hypothetical protein M0802_004813 [Mischocyttarus mexicanus]
MRVVVIAMLRANGLEGHCSEGALGEFIVVEYLLAKGTVAQEREINSVVLSAFRLRIVSAIVQRDFSRTTKEEEEEEEEKSKSEWKLVVVKGGKVECGGNEIEIDKTLKSSVLRKAALENFEFLEGDPCSRP